jgi:hypothetical protein
MSPGAAGVERRTRRVKPKAEEGSVAEPFLSEIRIMSFQVAPKGWALCNGQLLPINQNQALFSLLAASLAAQR